jgi:glutaredoxin
MRPTAYQWLAIAGRDADTPGMSIEIRLYSRPDCHLCDDMKLVVAPIAREFGARVEEIHVDGDAALEARFGTEVPVLFINGRKAFKYRVEERELRARLQRESL